MGMQLDWSKFVVFENRGKLSPNDSWRPNDAVFPISTCDRRLYLSVGYDFEDVPPTLKNRPTTKILRGVDAYSLIVSFYTGCESTKKYFETDTTRQFLQSWNSYNEKLLGKGTKESKAIIKELMPYKDAIISDGRIVRNNILLPHLRQPNAINVAVDMLPIVPGSEVLVVCGDVDESLRAASALGSRRITVKFTHPMFEKLIETREEVSKLKSIKANVKFIDIDRALNKDIVDAQAVVFCPPVIEVGDENPCVKNINELVSLAWAVAREKKPNAAARLVHVKGALELPSAWSWMPFENIGLIPNSVVSREFYAKKETMIKIAQSAKETIEFMGERRMDGDRVANLTFDENTMTPTYVISRRPLGRDVAALRKQEKVFSPAG